MKTGLKILIIISSVLTVLLLAGQTLSLINYDLTVSLGLQETVKEITQLGIFWANGFAFSDTVVYIPLLIAGIVGLFMRKPWGLYTMFGSLSISVYWPIVHIFTINIGRDAMNLGPDKYILFMILLPLIVIYGLWGMWYLYKNREGLD